jgi:hypothetical protein
MWYEEFKLIWQKHKFHMTLAEWTTSCTIIAFLSLVSVPVILFFDGYGNSQNMGLYMILIFLAGAGLVSVPISLIFLISLLVWRWRKSKSFEKFMIFFLLVILTTGGSVFYVFKKGVQIRDYAMRLKVDRTGGIEQLQAWANNMLERPEDEVLMTPESPYVNKELLSEQVKAISDMDIVSLHSESQGKYLKIRVGGGGFIQRIWGIIITSPTTNIEDVYEYSYRKWQDGVYAY